MKRFPLTVECLEDRCVPDATPTTQAVAVVVPPVTTTVNQSYVIDPPLIDPNAPPPQQTPPPVATPLPTDLVPPIPVPFWS
jgi:hypothetical protein